MTRGERCTVGCMFGHQKMRAYRTSHLSCIPRFVSRAKIPWERTSASSRPSLCRLDGAGGREVGCEPECHNLCPAGRVRTAGRILFAEDSATFRLLAFK